MKGKELYKFSEAYARLNKETLRQEILQADTEKSKRSFRRIPAAVTLLSFVLIFIVSAIPGLHGLTDYPQHKEISADIYGDMTISADNAAAGDNNADANDFTASEDNKSRFSYKGFRLNERIYNEEFLKYIYSIIEDEREATFYPFMQYAPQRK